MYEGKTKKTIGSLQGDEVEETISIMPLDTLMDIDLENGMMLSLAYGSSNRYEFVYGTDENGEFKRYFATVDGVTYLYEMDGDSWVKYTFHQSVDYSNTRYSLFLNSFQEIYSSLTYKEDETVFRATTLTLTNPEDEMEKETLRDVTVKFVEKQFVSISFVADTLNEDGEVIENVSCYLSIVDQGKTSVTLPSV